MHFNKASNNQHYGRSSNESYKIIYFCQKALLNADFVHINNLNKQINKITLTKLLNNTVYIIIYK